MEGIRPRGYTIIELLVVLAVLGVLATLAMPLAELNARRDKERELKRALWEIRDAIDAYKRVQDASGAVRAPDASGYPATLEALVAGVDERPTKGPARRVYFLRRVPRDPFADPSLPADKSWGQRSYQSAPDSPQPGADVYDVHSQSTLIGLNGVPLREW